MKHRTRDGKTIELTEMENSHLINTIRLHQRKAKEGLVVRRGGGSDPDSYWYEELTLTGNDALEKLKTQEYINEANRRGLVLS